MIPAKRVILRLREAEVDYEDPYEAVLLYLKKNDHSVQEPDAGLHLVHVQSSNPGIPQADPKIHIVIDVGKDRFSGTPLDDEHFPHEVYRVRRQDDGEMWIFSYWCLLICLILTLTLGQICLSGWCLVPELCPPMTLGKTRHDCNLSIHTIVLNFNINSCLSLIVS